MEPQKDENTTNDQELNVIEEIETIDSGSMEQNDGKKLDNTEKPSVEEDNHQFYKKEDVENLLKNTLDKALAEQEKKYEQKMQTLKEQMKNQNDKGITEDERSEIIKKTADQVRIEVANKQKLEEDINYLPKFINRLLKDKAIDIDSKEVDRYIDADINANVLNNLNIDNETKKELYNRIVNKMKIMQIGKTAISRTIESNKEVKKVLPDPAVKKSFLDNPIKPDSSVSNDDSIKRAEARFAARMKV